MGGPSAAAALRGAVRTLAAALLLGGVFLAGCAGTPEGAPPPRSDDGLPDLSAWDPGAGPTERLLVVSVTGLTADRTRPGGGMPTLARMAGNGVRVARLAPVAPAAAYPVHVTYDTGTPPRDHGVAGDRLLGERGVGRQRMTDALSVERTRVWQPLLRGGELVAAFDWPATEKSKIPLLIPDLAPGLADNPARMLQAGASATLIEPAAREGVALAQSGAARDAFLAHAACRVIAARKPPRLVLLRLTQTQRALRAGGPDSDAARTAFARVDAELERLVRCLADADRLAGATLVVLGDAAWQPVHSVVRPNRILADAGLIDREAGAWRAILRANGGSAFLYANDTQAALEARRLLSDAANRTGAFRVVGAEEMIELQTDPQAWFGLEAEPGFTLVDSARGVFLQAAPFRGGPAPGLLPERDAATAGLVAFGRGVRRGIEVQRMRQIDVGPTLAMLLRTELPEARGTAFVGMLRIESRVSGPPRLIPVPGQEGGR